MIGSQVKVIEFLTRLPLFTGVSSGVMERIANGTSELHAPRDTAVYRRGQTASGIHVVVVGQVRHSLRSSNGDERIMEVIGEGQAFGGPAMFLQRPHLLDAETVLESRLLHIDKNTLLAEVSSDPGFSQKMITSLSEQLYRHVENLEICMLSSGMRRVVRYLLTHQHDDQFDGAVQITLPTKKWIIASSLNLTQEHFSRILGALVRDDLIEVNGRTIHIRDREKLRCFAD